MSHIVTLYLISRASESTICNRFQRGLLAGELQSVPRTPAPTLSVAAAAFSTLTTSLYKQSGGRRCRKYVPVSSCRMRLVVLRWRNRIPVSTFWG